MIPHVVSSLGSIALLVVAVTAIDRALLGKFDAIFGAFSRINPAFQELAS